MLSPGGDSVATRSGSRIRLWDTTTGRLLRSFNGASTAVSDLAFSPDGKMLLSSRESGLDGIMNAWPLRLGEEIASVRPSNSRGRRVLFDREGSRFYATAFRNIGAWGTRMGRPEWTFRSESRVFLDLAIHPTDGSVILSEGAKPAFTHVSSAGEPLDAFGTNLFSSVKFSRDGQLLLAVDNAFDATDPGATFRVMEYPSGALLRKIPLQNPRQPFAAFCLDDAALATAALAGGITVWDWKAGTPLRQIDAAQTGSIGCLAASPDGLHLPADPVAGFRRFERPLKPAWQLIWAKTASVAIIRERNSGSIRSAHE